MRSNRYGSIGTRILTIVMLFITAIQASAATIFWQGGNGAGWGTAANWSPAQVPASGDDVVFTANAASFDVDLGGDRTVNKVTFQVFAVDGYQLSGGALTLESGELWSEGGGQTHTVNCDVVVSTQAYFLISTGDTVILNNPISESGGSVGIRKRGNGTLRLNSANSFTGDVLLEVGTIALDHNEALRQNTIQISSGQTLSVGGADAIVGGVRGSGVIDMTGAARFRAGENDSDSTFSGSIVGTGYLTKVGTGNLRIESALSGFSGRLMANEGTLTVNGATTRRTHVESGATLAGNGSVGLLAAAPGSTVSPGDNGVGTITINGVFQSQNGEVDLEIGGTTAGMQHDQIIVNGNVTAYGGLNFSYVNGFVAAPTDEFVFLQATTLSGSGTINSLPDGQAWLLDRDNDAGTLTLRICPVTSGDCNNNGIGDECEPDSDGDGIINDCDICNNGPNDQDADGDGVPDGCDVCPGVDDNGPDADGDGYPDPCDGCHGNDNSGDSDNDGICNNLDVCPGFDDTVDTDGDSVPDGCDACPGFDDFGPDADGDWIVDACDECRGDNETGDSDGDGVCDDADACPGFDDAVDTDGDGVADGCDACSGFDDNGPDADGDGVVDGCDQCQGDDAVGDADDDGRCDDTDICPGFDDAQDADGDGIPDGCDLCEGDDTTGDSDGDGRCDNLDNCPGEDDFGPDADGDGLADVCDFCHGEDTGDLDGDEDIDADDFAGFEYCLTGPALSAGVVCDCYDMDGDDEATIRDYAMFQRVFTGPSYVEEAPGEINLQNIINGLSDKGHAFFGRNDTDLAGYSVALIGDINGDGYGEMVIGAPSYGTDVIEHAGRVYVVYGRTDLTNIVLENIASGVGGFVMDGTGGFDHDYPTQEIGESVVYPDYFNGDGGPQGEGAGFDVAPAGDVNGDGIPDIIVSAPYGVANGAIWGGRTYVVFGGGSVGGTSPITLNALTLAGQGTGFMIEGERGICLTCPDEFVGERNGDLSGWAVDGARDVNGDGLADILVSAKNYGDDDGGRAYAVFGKTSGASVNLASIGAMDGPGLLFDVSDFGSAERLGYRMFGVSDYTGEGLTDFMLTAQLGNLSYIARSIGTAGTIALTGGIPVEHVTILQGANLSCSFGVDEETGEPLANGCTGRAVFGFPNHGGGDFDGDGRPDFARMMWNFDRDELEIMVYFNTQGNFVNLGGRFGEPEAPFDIPNRGVRIYSSNVSAATWKNEITLNSDINGDGYDDVVIGIGRGSGSGAQSTYVVFGGPDSRSVNLDTLAADGNGIKISGDVNGTQPGFAVDSSGDLNGDGINDILIGDPRSDRIGQNAGSFYLVYGDDFSGSITHRGDESANTLNGSAADDAMVGGRGDDVLIGNGGFDSMYGGAGDDVLVVGDAGFHRVRGGEGFDTLAVDGGVSLDLETLRGRIDEIEQIDLSATGADSLRVTRIDILNLSPTSNQLYVLGRAEDEFVSASEHWNIAGTVDVNGTMFKKFTDGRAELFVQDEISLRFAPYIVTESIDMPENTAVNASIGFISAIDPDGGQIVEFAILGGDGQDYFDIDTATGELFVTSKMNYEALSTPMFTLDVQVADNSGEIDTATITVNILDQNEMPMWTVQDQLITSIDEHPQTGLLVGNFSAIDPDGGDEVRYYLDLTDPALLSPAVEGAFAVNELTGKLKVANGALLDYEMQETHEMILYAEDLAGLRTEPILITFMLDDVGTWVQQFDGTFVTTGASMWGSNQGVGLSTMGFVKDVDLDNTSSQSRSILGQELVGQVQGQLHFETTIDTDSGYVDATIPLSVEVSFPDEVIPGQSVNIGLNLLTSSQSPTMSGMTPATNVDMRLDYTDFAIITNFKTFGPNTGSATADEYLINLSGQPWSAVVQPNGSLATASTVTTRLMEFGEVDWDSYLENFLSGTNLPSNEGENLPYPLGPVTLNVSYVLWGFTMSGEAKVDQDLSLDVNGYYAVIEFENGSTQPMIVGGDTNVTVPGGADVNGDGFVDYEIRVDIDTTFTNNSDFYGTVFKRMTFGYFDILGFVPDCTECGTEHLTFGPLFDEAVPVDVFQNDALGDYPTPWPEGEAGQFPLDGFNTLTFSGSIDLNN